MRKLLALLAAAVLSITGCGLFQRHPIALYTNRPEMASYVEYFNALQTDLRVVLRYRDAPVDALLKRSENADLVLGTRLNGYGASRNLEPLDDLFRGDRFRRQDFYAPLLASGVLERKQVLLPLSFSLPAVVFLSHSLRDPIPPLSLSLDFLKERGGQFNQNVRGSPIRLGFSPLWDGNFLYVAAELQGARLREEPSGAVGWNEKALQEGVSYLKGWVFQTNGGLSQEDEFSRKYLYQPLGRLLDEKRILFHLTDSRLLMRVLEDHKEEADFRWLAWQDRIFVAEDILFVGIPRTAKRKKAAKLFMKWLFQAETQKRLLEIARKKRLDFFGIAGGFSALKAVNEREFPQYYPRLIGRLPPEELLYVPGPLPPAWEELKAQALIPWLRDAASSSGEDGMQGLAGRLRSSRAGKSRK